MATRQNIPEFILENPAKVFFTPVETGESTISIAAKTNHMMERANFASIIEENTLVAIKQHFGEKGNENYTKPLITKRVVDLIKGENAFPLLVETNTLYKGDRSDTYHHLMIAHSHGFSIENVGAPVIIMDGVHGQNQRPVAIPGKHFNKVNLVSDIPFFNAMFIVSHVKGHMLSAMGGAIKNLGMGFASRAGKLAQHNDFKPQVDADKCTLCEVCTNYCPETAITLKDDIIVVSNDKCIGCGECYAACQFDAISFKWEDADRKFNEKMTEHAFGAVINHNKKVAYLNFLIDISKQCDCWSEDNPVIYDNVGIFASYDPIAIDQACLDIGAEKLGKNVFKEMWPELDATFQLEHGENIGMGTRNYTLVEI
jgi:uncharacterized Fe-S center protein